MRVKTFVFFEDSKVKTKNDLNRRLAEVFWVMFFGGLKKFAVWRSPALLISVIRFYRNLKSARLVFVNNNNTRSTTKQLSVVNEFCGLKTNDLSVFNSRFLTKKSRE